MSTLGIENLALRMAMNATRHGRWRQFLRATERPMDIQRKLLARIIAENAATEFGQDHDFASISSYETYRELVPVTTYEDLRPLIEGQEGTEEPCLTRADPVIYTRTSGTTGPAKLIPVTRAGLQRLRDTQRLFAYAQYSGSSFYDGKVLAMASPAIEGRLLGGKPYGSATGLIYRSMPRLIRRKYVIPPALFGIDDYDAKYYAIAALGLRERNVTGLAAANPSTFLKLLAVINTHWEQLIEDIATGRLDVADRLTADQAEAVAQRFSKCPARARELMRLRARSDSLRFADIWPALGGVVTWTGGSCGYMLAALAEQWPAGAKVIDAGYAASEFWGSVNLDIERGSCVPTLLTTFFEFVERSDWEAGRRRFLTLDQIVEGRQYYVFATTQEGLYRYDINDIVRVTGRFNETPTIAFVQKGRGVTNITGEKLSESQVLQAMTLAQSECHLRPAFFVALADEAAAQYRIYVESMMLNGTTAEALAERLDRHLRDVNIEYSQKRSSARLNGCCVTWIRPGTSDAYRRHCIANGQRDAQYKTLQLQYKKDCAFDFSQHQIAGG